VNSPQPEFWENAFQKNQRMWGESPTVSAKLTADICEAIGFQKILIPGIGYGRNAKPFLDLDMEVTGIEISETAIAMGKQRFGTLVNWIHGSVTAMPFDEMKYEVIFCHALIHLLDAEERKKLIADCFGRLSERGVMVFTAITKNSDTYGDAIREGTVIGTDRFKTRHGVELFFYDEASIKAEFGAFGLMEQTILNEPVNGRHDSTTPFWKIRCDRSEARQA
jgi:2-polyprenyl-3-methyl-5-hydroxy-6-metoxy-1,4-benzoquinol methylase